MKKLCLGLLLGLALGLGLPTFAQAPVTVDRNDHPLKVGNFVQIPCIVTSITPSLNPALTSVGCQTLPNVTQGADYDEGLPLIVYPSQVIKP